tara:strand:- start:509 stop:1336 length:828 start_codon:yes stop_codon:yes gene_type:complete
MKKIFFYIFIFSTLFPQSRETPESSVYKQCKNKVFKVFGSGHGSGFLINNKGLILTNDHVIGRNTHNINVQINDSIKVRAKLVARDRDKDLATVVVNPKVVKSLGLKRFDFPSRNERMIIEGEKVVAIGSPLDQDKIITSGIVSSFTDKVIMHDVNINPGNSGGPLINMNSEVIGVNSFVNQDRSGPGIYGSVNISEAYSIINKSMSVLDKMDIQNISTRLLPITPTEIFPLNALRESLDKYYPESVYNLNAEKFKINFFTPPRQYHLEHIDRKN